MLTLLVLAGFCQPAAAVNLYWVGTNAGATVSSPSDGIWDASTTAAWNTSGSGAADSLWVSADVGVFSGAVGSYNVTMGSAVTVLGADFATAGSTYTLSASSARAISVNGSSGSLQLQVESGVILNVSSNVTFNPNGSRSYQIGGSGSGAAGTINILNGGSVINNQNGRSIGVDGFGTVVNVYAGGQWSQTSAGAGNNQLGIAGSVGSACTVNVEGGTVADAGPAPGSFFTVGGGGNGTLTVNSGVVNCAATSGGLRLGQSAGASGTLNLNGGTMTVPILFKGGDNTTVATVNFNGGTLKANTNNASFMSGLSAANVLARGAVIDDGGKTITMGQDLLGGVGSTGGLTKLGAGTLTLTGANTYVGPTVVSNGVLITTTASVGSGSYTVNNGATLGVLVSVAGSSLTCSSLTLGTSAAATLNFLLGANASDLVPAIHNNGALTLNGTITINVDGTFGVGTNLLMTCGSRAGTGSFVLGTAPVIAGYTPQLIDNGTKLELVYLAPPAAVTWATGSGNWDTSSLNWVVTGTSTPTNYMESAPVTFDDTASGSSPITVTLTATHTPSLITNNATKNYVMTDGGNGYSLAGNGGLVKAGSGTLTMNLNATYAGATVISGGTVALGQAGAISGSTSITVATNTTLDVLGRSDKTLTLNNAQTLTGSGKVAGSLLVSAGATVAPGDTIGRLTVQSNIVLNGTTVIELNRDNPGQMNDELISAAGSIVGGGTLTVTNLGSIPQLGDVYQIFNQPVSGFTTVKLPSVSPQIWANNLAGNGSIKVVPTSGTLIWTGAGTTNAPGNGNWDATTGNMWSDGDTNSGNSVWLAGYNAVFGGAAGACTVNVNATISAYNMRFQNSGYTLSATNGRAIQLTEGAQAGLDISQVQMAPGTTNTIGTNVSISTSATCFVGGADVTPAGTLILNGGAIVQGNSGYSINIDGVGTYVSVAGGGNIQNTSTGAGSATITVGAQANANSTLSVDGGTVSVSGPNQKINVGGAGIGVLTVNSGTVSMPSTSVTALSVNNGTVNLNGGVINVPMVAGYGTFNFNGGTLKANQAQASFISLGVVNILTNGAVIDDGGHAIGIGQTLQSGASPGGGLTKLGAGTLTLAAGNTYTGNTVVSNGTLILATSSAVASSAAIRLAGGATLDVSAIAPFTVSASQVLAGTGAVNGSVQVDGLLVPAGTLTFSNDLTINGNLQLGLNKFETLSNDLVVVNGMLNNLGAGTLIITNRGPALAVGDKFTLFSQPLPNGGNLNIVPPAGVTFQNNLALDGSIQVLTAPAVAANPTNITVNVSGTTLNLSWPGDHLGWIAQSNSTSLSDANGWFDVINSQNQTNLAITINPGAGHIFYRLRKP